MTTMLDKMARAMAVSDGYSEAQIDASRGDQRLNVMPEYIINARAALKAIREPSVEMICAAWTKADIDDAVNPAAAWPAMIDAILNERALTTNPL